MPFYCMHHIFNWCRKQKRAEFIEVRCLYSRTCQTEIQDCIKNYTVYRFILIRWKHYMDIYYRNMFWCNLCKLYFYCNIMCSFDNAYIFLHCFKWLAPRISSCYITKGDKTLANDQNHATKSDVCIYPPIIIMSRMKEKTQSAVIVFVLDNFTLYISSFPSGTHNLLW